MRTLPFPDFLATTSYSLTLHSGLSEDGEPIPVLEARGKCLFSEKVKRSIDKEGKQTTLLGEVIIKGDIAPGLDVSDGVITLTGKTYAVHAGQRPRNPDGSVHYTGLELK